MRMRLTILFAFALLVSLACASPASADFGFKDLEGGGHEVDVTFNNSDGTIARQAGAHPFSMTTTLGFNTRPSPEMPEGPSTMPAADVKDLRIFQMPGLVGDPTAVPQCTDAEFFANPPATKCPVSSRIGYAETTTNPDVAGGTTPAAVYNLTPPPGVAQKIGFYVIIVPVTVELGVNESPPYNVVASLPNTPNVVPVFRSEVTLWGVPAAKVHDSERGGPVSISEEPYLTMPRACTGPLATEFEADSWDNKGLFDKATAITHDDAGNPQGMIGCGKLGFNPSITAQPTSKAAQSPSGLDFSLEVKDEGLTNPSEEATAHSDIRKVEVTLPEGFTTNPAIAEGLEVCTESQLAAERAKSSPGAGCPDASKIGTVEVETPLLEENVNGSLFIAKPYENPFDSLLALYIVIKNPTLGIVVRQALEVKPDPVTGRLTTVAEDLPQLPFSSFRLHFREGARSPLATPPACGTHNVIATLYPWAGGTPKTSSSAFQIISGPNSGPCPSGGLPPFRPGLLAGTLNNRAGSYSPFNLRLSRSDSEQEFTRFSIKLPPGITGKLAGIPFCSDQAIEAAKHRTGTEEESSPSCPKASEVGRTLAGAGVGPSPAYAPGKIYLAGPYNGSALSIAAITAAKVGPFDLGTVVIRQALQIDRNTAEVFIDATGSDPIPHIIDGIQVHAQDIRAYVDRPDFTLNPTSCERTSTASTVLGSGLDFGSEADDNTDVVSTPFQAADCAALPFDPKLSFRLIGGTKRGAHPRLRAVVRMRPGEANISYARVTLPRSAFLDQSHIGTVCTRVQFAQKACPKASIYGYAKAITPLFETPVEGPIYLRSSSNKLPDLVAALANGKIEFDLVGRIDSLKGRIRNTFDFVPDAPVTQAVFNFQGGNKGLIVNSTNLCRGKHKAVVELDGHNAKAKDFRPAVTAKCKGKGRKGAKRPR